MRNLLNFLARFNQLIIFLILEGIAIYLLGTRNSYHNSAVVGGIRGVTTGLEEKISNTRSYFHLREINQALALENVLLKDRIEKLVATGNSVFSSVTDTIYKQQYVFTSAKIIENSVNRQKNFFILNKGKKQGLNVDMAVTAGENIAGVIVGCSENYSVVMSVLNLDFRLSARIKSNGYFGSLSWDGRDYRHAILSEIPQHVTFGLGDTVETTGYSAIFPEGTLIGTISDLERSGSDFWKIRVLLFSDFKRLQFVEVVGNLKKIEQLELEKTFK